MLVNVFIGLSAVAVAITVLTIREDIPVIIGSLRAVLDIYPREYVQATPAEPTTTPEEAVAEDIQSDATPTDDAQPGPQPHDTAGGDE